MNYPTLINWYNDVQVKQTAHLNSARIYELWNNFIGFTAILAAIIAGYEVTQQNIRDLPSWTIVLGIFAIIAAVSNAALKFFGFENKKQRHHTSASLYASLQYEIERWVMGPEKQIPDNVYERISNQLSEIDKNAPLIKKKIFTKAKKEIQNKEYKEIPIYNQYETEMEEMWKIEEGEFNKMGPNPVRTYLCDPINFFEYVHSNKIIIHGRHKMTREGEEIPTDLEGNGIIDNNICYIQYSVRSALTGVMTFGTMVLTLTNKTYIEGYWMTGGVIGADYLLGTIKMKLIENK